MAKKKTTKRRPRSKQSSRSTSDESEHNADQITSSNSDSTDAGRTPIKRKRSKRKVRASKSSDDSSADSSDSRPILPAVEHVNLDSSFDDAEPVANVPSPIDSHISATDDLTTDFDRDFTVNVTRLSNNLSRVLAKHKLSAIPNFHMRKPIAGKQKTKQTEVKQKSMRLTPTRYRVVKV